MEWTSCRFELCRVDRLVKRSHTNLPITGQWTGWFPGGKQKQIWSLEAPFYGQRTSARLCYPELTKKISALRRRRSEAERLCFRDSDNGEGSVPQNCITSSIGLKAQVG